MPKYEIKWTKEQWYKATVEADNREKAEDLFWEEQLTNVENLGGEIQDSLEIREIDGKPAKLHYFAVYYDSENEEWAIDHEVNLGKIWDKSQQEWREPSNEFEIELDKVAQQTLETSLRLLNGLINGDTKS